MSLPHRLARALSGALRRLAVGPVPKLFDADHYLARAPGAARSGLDPYLHYAWFGARAGLDPSADFDTAFYRRQSGPTRLDPLRHYVEIGAPAGLDPSPAFSTSLYLARYPDVVRAGVNPLLHFRTDGRAEGREAVPSALEPHRLRALDGVASEHERHYPDAPGGRFALRLLRDMPPSVDAAFAPRVCLMLGLDGAEYEALVDALACIETGPQDAIALHVDAGAGPHPPVPTLCLALERCTYALSADGREIALAYAEARVWDLRLRTPGVAAVFPAGCLSARHIGPGEAWS